MKADIPITRSEFFAAAERRGLHVIQNVSAQRLTVASLEDFGPVLRLFAPDLRMLPDGTQIDGSVGLALRAVDGGYQEALFHHILNLATLREADRIIRHERDWDGFFALLVAALKTLPAQPAAVAAILQDETSWMSKELKWRRPNAISFQRRASELAAS